MEPPKVQYRVEKSLPMVPFLSQMSPVHTFPPYSPRIHSVITLPSTPCSSKWYVPFRLSDQNFVYSSQLTMRATYSTHHILPDLITPITYFVHRTSYEAPQYKFFSNLPPLPSS